VLSRPLARRRPYLNGDPGPFVESDDCIPSRLERAIWGIALLGRSAKGLRILSFPKLSWWSLLRPLVSRRLCLNGEPGCVELVASTPKNWTNHPLTLSSRNNRCSDISEGISNLTQLLLLKSGLTHNNKSVQPHLPVVIMLRKHAFSAGSCKFLVVFYACALMPLCGQTPTATRSVPYPVYHVGDAVTLTVVSPQQAQQPVYCFRYRDGIANEMGFRLAQPMPRGSYWPKAR